SFAGGEAPAAMPVFSISSLRLAVRWRGIRESLTGAVMSSLFGEIRQLGYVVRDIEAAMAFWSRTLGVGPWYYNPRVPIENYRYRGEAHEPHNSVALANSGFVQVELIQCRNDVPS